jgi:quercetin dioxygenase-like cupin family protein
MDNCNGSKNVLEACMGKSQELASLVDYASDSVVSKTILDKPAGTITLFAFDKGQKLSEHTAPYDAVVQVVDGTAQITIDDKGVSVSAGSIIIMPANVPHAVDALEKFKMLLTMIRTKK